MYIILILFLGGFAVFFGIPFLTGAPYAPTSKNGVDVMIRLAQPTSADRALEIGSGDGRLVIALAKAGAKTDGVEINPWLVLWSRLKIKKAGLEQTARIMKQNVWKFDFSDYTIITVFGIAHIMNKLAKKIEREAQPGTRIVSNRFSLPGWTPVTKENGIYLYIKD